MSFASIFLYLADTSVFASQSEAVLGELILTVSCADFFFAPLPMVTLNCCVSGKALPPTVRKLS